MLDENLRARLRHLAAAEDDDLDTAARARVVARIGAEGPAVVRRARRARAAVGAGVVVAAAAAAAFYFGVASQGTEPPSAPVAHEPDLPQEHPPAVPARPCEGREDPSAVAVGFSTQGGRSVLDLGVVAHAESAPSADVYLQEATRCRTVIHLRSGRVAVHAKDLGGGALVVKSGDVAVEVRGTIFGVSRSGETLAVEVAEGRVVVARPERQPIAVDGGTRLRLDQRDDSFETVLLDAHESHALLSEAAGVRPDAAAPTPRAESPEALLRRADELRNAGDLEAARRLYRRAGSGVGPGAEAAWVALARLELSAGNAAAARDATQQRGKRFGGGTLGAESLWINVRTHRQAGNTAAARRTASELVARWPASPQADAARRYLATDDD